MPKKQNKNNPETHYSKVQIFLHFCTISQQPNAYIQRYAKIQGPENELYTNLHPRLAKWRAMFSEISSPSEVIKTFFPGVSSIAET